MDEIRESVVTEPASDPPDVTQRGLVETADPAAHAQFAPESAVPRDTPAKRFAKDVNLTQPGRFTDITIPAKPAANETEYRSSYFVTARHSADGNEYHRGEPIPEVEAMRQGLVVSDTEKARIAKRELRRRIPHGTCPKCRGSGKAARMKGHKPDCGCPGCAPCARCGGSGFTRLDKEA
jgi:hypothetical protein